MNHRILALCILSGSPSPESPSQSSETLPETSSVITVWEHLRGRHCKRSRGSLGGKGPMDDILWAWSRKRDRTERQVSMQCSGLEYCALELKEHFSSLILPQTQSFPFYVLLILNLISFALNIKTQNFSLCICWLMRFV